MSSLSIDEKMLLIQQMRSRSEKASPAYIHDTGVFPSNEMNSDEITGEFRSLKLRIFVCLIAFSGFFALHKLNFEVKGHSVTEVNSVLEEDILPQSLQDSLETMSQNLMNSQFK